MLPKLVPQARFELAKALLLRQVGVPVSISHRGEKMAEGPGLEPGRSQSKCDALPTRLTPYKIWCFVDESNIGRLRLQRSALPTELTKQNYGAPQRIRTFPNGFGDRRAASYTRETKVDMESHTGFDPV